MKTIAAGLMLLFALAIADESFADPGQTRHYGHRYRHCSKDFWGRCKDGRPSWRYYGHHYHRPAAIDRGAFCHPRRRVVGEERPSKEKALKAADDAWMGAVRYDHGERYQDLNHAKDVRHNCDPSSTSSVLKRVHFRCAVEATPCRAPTGAVEARVDRRYDQDESDDDDRPRKR